MPATELQKDIDSAFLQWHEKLASLSNLIDGWNGYTAPAPNQVSLQNARHLLDVMQSMSCQPARIAASAMGGIAVTGRQDDRKVLIECYNDGRLFALFSKRGGEMTVSSHEMDEPSLRSLIDKMREYLHG